MTSRKYNALLEILVIIKFIISKTVTQSKIKYISNNLKYIVKFFLFN